MSTQVNPTTSRERVCKPRLEHVPTPEQIDALVHFDGDRPCSYLLDPWVNHVPEGLEGETGQYALCFTAHDSRGLMELVVARDGAGFDLLGGCRLMGRAELLSQRD